ncbi:MAG: VWA domain-containing protein [Lachnospiraceae bacterium]|nr:VWA domain-containing protein [Lachnospiraceae bacterium]
MKGKRVLVTALSMLTAFTMIPSNVMADEGSTDDLKISKTAVLEDDGTYTITLDAYATGTVTTTTVTEAIPTDIVLVLDESGSMMSNDMMINGIPSGYEKADPTHGEALNGKYYYKTTDKDGVETYNRVSVTRETVGYEEKWKGDDGQYYTDDQLAYSWTGSTGDTYTTARPFVDSSLVVFYRDKSWGAYIYKKDNNLSHYTGSVDTVGGALHGTQSMSSLRSYFYNSDWNKTPWTGEQQNNGGSNNSDYTAASYIAVSKEKVYTYKYTYTYTNAANKMIKIGEYTGTDSDKPVDTELYTAGATTKGYRIDALRYAANNFISSVRQNAIANNVDHRIAVVGFGSDNSNRNYLFSNQELFVGATQYNLKENGLRSTYNKSPNLAADHYADAFQSVGNNAGYSNLNASIAALDAYGSTYPSYGLEMAKGVFDNSNGTFIDSTGTEQNRKKIVIFLTDGEPGQNADNFSDAEADKAIANAQLLKKDGATVYSIAVLDKEPAAKNDAFLRAVDSDGEYSLATNAESLDDIFTGISTEIDTTTTTVTLDDKAILSDFVSDSFTMEEGATVELSVAKHTGYESFAAPTAAPAGVAAEMKGNTVSVKGFDYTSDENLVTTNVADGGATGNKLIVTIKGVVAKDQAATGAFVSTNTPASGIYNPDEENINVLVKPFEQPMVKIGREMFVLDYAKETTLDVQNVDTISYVDDASDSIMNSSTTAVVPTGNYGAIAQAGNDFTYTPSTMQWSGYDSAYAFGKKDAVNAWTKVSVIPATSVFYEDDFTTDGETGRVGIVYSNDWSVDGTASGNTETANNEVQGWIDSMADDTGFSDGSAHGTNTARATATFTFTGTGMDVYSRTDMTAGTVLVQIKGTDDSGVAVNKVFAVDNKSVDTYYQIPTLTVSGLEHGTYEAKITVTTAAEGRSTFWLDGIRIYNPISDADADTTVDVAYEEQNIAADAIFTPVRDILIDTAEENKTDVISGSVYIEKTYNDEGLTVTSLGVYKDYGPKNEVYVEPGYMVMIPVEDFAQYYYIGLKAPAGETAAKISDGTEIGKAVTIANPADLYYPVKPYVQDGISYIAVENTGSNLLSITKLSISGFNAAQASDGIMTAALPVENYLSAAQSFSLLPSVSYVPGEDTEIDTPETEGPGDVIIDNGNQEETPETPAKPQTWIEKVFNTIKGWFK